MSTICIFSGTRLPAVFIHQNVGEGNKSLNQTNQNAMSPDSFLGVAFGKGSGLARLLYLSTRSDPPPAE